MEIYWSHINLIEWNEHYWIVLYILRICRRYTQLSGNTNRQMSRGFSCQIVYNFTKKIKNAVKFLNCKNAVLLSSKYLSQLYTFNVPCCSGVQHSGSLRRVFIAFLYCPLFTIFFYSAPFLFQVKDGQVSRCGWFRNELSCLVYAFANWDINIPIPRLFKIYHNFSNAPNFRAQSAKTWLMSYRV